jgi:hypothetical protein
MVLKNPILKKPSRPAITEKRKKTKFKTKSTSLFKEFHNNSTAQLPCNKQRAHDPNPAELNGWG